MSFWESSVEGKYPWHKRKLGWKLKLGKYYITHRYHFNVLLMIALLLALPFVISGWNIKLFGIILSAISSGLIIEDFLWFIVNPAIKFKQSFNPKFADYYPWTILGNFKIPTFYILGIIISLLSWFFLWR
jgi:hypothetical protein